MFDNYRYYTDGKSQVIAVSSYAGKPVRGVARCSSQDEFDLEKGKRIAAARCNVKVARKRVQRASLQQIEAEKEMTQMIKQLHRVHNYYWDSCEAYCNAQESLEDILAEM